MRELGASLAYQLEPGDIVLLHGDLGAGKTTLAQGMLASFGIDDPAQSPTFTLDIEYPISLGDGSATTLHHLDLYRLDDPSQLDELGWDDLVASDTDMMIVEWPERAMGRLPEQYLLVSIVHVYADSRAVVIREMA
jgi:tRNA threonylcarbamoyladenosine biosynthesis protein TsaE